MLAFQKGTWKIRPGNILVFCWLFFQECLFEISPPSIRIVLSLQPEDGTSGSNVDSFQQGNTKIYGLRWGRGGNRRTLTLTAINKKRNSQQIYLFLEVLLDCHIVPVSPALFIHTTHRCAQNVDPEMMEAIFRCKKNIAAPLTVSSKLFQGFLLPTALVAVFPVEADFLIGPENVFKTLL